MRGQIKGKSDKLQILTQLCRIKIQEVKSMTKYEEMYPEYIQIQEYLVPKLTDKELVNYEVFIVMGYVIYENEMPDRCRFVSAYEKLRRSAISYHYKYGIKPLIEELSTYETARFMSIMDRKCEIDDDARRDFVAAYKIKNGEVRFYVTEYEKKKLSALSEYMTSDGTRKNIEASYIINLCRNSGYDFIGIMSLLCNRENGQLTPEDFEMYRNDQGHKK